MQNLPKENLKNYNIKPGLYLISTPIGNLEDITLRAINILKNSHIILCEDTRISLNLLKKYNIKAKLISNHKFNEKKNIEKILEKIKKKNIISLISDAGTPTISDPGRFLVNACIEKNFFISPVPGPSAITTAVSMSGFSDKYLFYGFLPNSDSKIVKELKKLSLIPFTIVFFISAKKINKIIKHLKFFFKERNILIAREMTKYYEEFIHTSISSLNQFNIDLRGELTLVISDMKTKKKSLNHLNESIKKQIKNMSKKYSSKDIVSFISAKENIPKKIIYEFCIKMKK